MKLIICIQILSTMRRFIFLLLKLLENPWVLTFFKKRTFNI